MKRKKFKPVCWIQWNNDNDYMPRYGFLSVGEYIISNHPGLTTFRLYLE